MSENHSESIPSRTEPLPEGVKGYRRDGRRVYEPGFRERVAAECRESGRSLSSVALHYRINPNLVRRWVDQFAPPATTMLPVSLTPLPVSPVCGVKPGQTQTSPTVLSVQVGDDLVTLNGHIEAAFVEAVVRALSVR